MSVWTALKVLHVFAGVLWMGGAIMLVFFIAPAIRATAPAGGVVMGHLSAKLKLPTVLNIAAWLTTLCGLALFWRISGGLHSSFFASSTGVALTIGSIAGVLAFIGAVFIQLPRSKRIAKLSAEAGPDPSPEQASLIQAEQQKFALGGKIVIGCFVVSLLGMLLSHPL